MKVLFLAACGVLLIPALSHAGAITTIYDASLGTLPEMQGFTSQVVAADNPTVSGGVLDVDGYSLGNNAAPGYYTGQNGTFLFDSFVMEGRLRILAATTRSSPGAGNFPRGGFVMSAVSQTGFDLGLEFGETGVWLQTSDGTALNPPASSFLNFDTTNGFHTYRVVANGSTASLYLDGATTSALSLAISSLQNSGGASTVLFGDASSLTRSHYQLQHFLFSSDTEATVAPEPGTFVLPGLAWIGVAIARRVLKR
jgi:hypothetical protein